MPPSHRRLLADRLVDAILWLNGQESDLEVFRLGCSVPAPEQRRRWSRSKNFLGALVVSRGGRPDLAGDALDSVYAPTLLIVGGADFDVIELNEQALARLPGTKALEIVPGAKSFVS